MIKTMMVILNIVIALLFFTIIYSAVNINVDISIMNSGYRGIQLHGDNLTATVPVKIENEGLYPIKDVNIAISITNHTTELYAHHFNIREIPALRSYQHYFQVTINILDIYKKVGTYYLFHSGQFEVSIAITAHYWLLADFTANYTKKMSWNPLLYTFNIYENKIHFDNSTVVVPYFISKIPVNVNATIMLTVADTHGSFAYYSGKMVFNKLACINAHIIRNVNYLATQQDIWTINIRANINGVSFTKTLQYTWHAPLRDMSIKEKLINNIPYAVLVFKNGYNSPLSFQIKDIFKNKDNSTTIRYENISLPAGKYANVPLFPITNTLEKAVVDIFVSNLNLNKVIILDEGVSA